MHRSNTTQRIFNPLQPVPLSLRAEKFQICHLNNANEIPLSADAKKEDLLQLIRAIEILQKDVNKNRSEDEIKNIFKSALSNNSAIDKGKGCNFDLIAKALIKLAKHRNSWGYFPIGNYFKTESIESVIQRIKSHIPDQNDFDKDLRVDLCCEDNATFNFIKGFFEQLSKLKNDPSQKAYADVFDRFKHLSVLSFYQQKENKKHFEAFFKNPHFDLNQFIRWFLKDKTGKSEGLKSMIEAIAAPSVEKRRGKIPKEGFFSSNNPVGKKYFWIKDGTITHRDPTVLLDEIDLHVKNHFEFKLNNLSYCKSFPKEHIDLILTKLKHYISSNETVEKTEKIDHVGSVSILKEEMKGHPNDPRYRVKVCLSGETDAYYLIFDQMRRLCLQPVIAASDEKYKEFLNIEKKIRRIEVFTYIPNWDIIFITQKINEFKNDPNFNSDTPLFFSKKEHDLKHSILLVKKEDGTIDVIVKAGKWKYLGTNLTAKGGFKQVKTSHCLLSFSSEGTFLTSKRIVSVSGYRTSHEYSAKKSHEWTDEEKQRVRRDLIEEEKFKVVRFFSNKDESKIERMFIYDDYLGHEIVSTGTLQLWKKKFTENQKQKVWTDVIEGALLKAQGTEPAFDLKLQNTLLQETGEVTFRDFYFPTFTFLPCIRLHESTLTHDQIALVLKKHKEKDKEYEQIAALIYMQITVFHLMMMLTQMTMLYQNNSFKEKKMDCEMKKFLNDTLNHKSWESFFTSETNIEKKMQQEKGIELAEKPEEREETNLRIEILDKISFVDDEELNIMLRDGLEKAWLGKLNFNEFNTLITEIKQKLNFPLPSPSVSAC